MKTQMRVPLLRRKAGRNGAARAALETVPKQITVLESSVRDPTVYAGKGQSKRSDTRRKTRSSGASD
jgi:hypothetical protein